MIEARQLLLETAFLSGLRANELRNLTTDHLNRDQGGLRLDAAWTKNRKPGFQPLPAALVDRLAAFAHSGEPYQLYERFYGRKTVKEAPPTQPLLYVPSHPARELDKDLLVAGIPKSTPAGKLDFHACRVAYINLVIESGVSVKEAQTLARHTTPQLTMNVYGRVREERLAQAIEKMAQSLLPEAECAPCVPHNTTETKEKPPTPLLRKALGALSTSGGGGNRTQALTSGSIDTYTEKSPQFYANVQHIKALSSIPSPASQHPPTLPEHQQDTSVQAKCVACVQHPQLSLPTDLREVADAWDQLPHAVKAGILAMVKAARHCDT